MAIITLADGTKVPNRYDFNEHFEPLIVKMQGYTWGGCWWETRCTILESFWRIYTDKAPTFDPHQLSHEDEGWAISHWSDTRVDPPRPLGTTEFIGGDQLTKLDGYQSLPARDAIVKALWTNGVIEGGVKCEQSMTRLWQKPYKYEGWSTKLDRFTKLPVLHPLAGDLDSVQKNSWAHSVIYVGYVWDKGIIFQNSWSSQFGKAGRAILGWDMLEKACADPGFIHAFNDHPANGLVIA